MNAAPVTAPETRRSAASGTGARARSRQSSFAFDIAFGLAMTVISLAASVAEGHPSNRFLSPGQHVPTVPPGAWVLIVASGLALIWRRRRPVLVLCISLACVVVYTCLGYFNGAVLLNPVFALYAAAATLPTRRALELSVLTMVALMASNAAFSPLGATGGGFFLIPLEVAAALFLGLWVGSRRAYVAREHDEEARRAVDAERLRIARELHDVVAHTMATINVQAGVAAHVIDQQPEQARRALNAIKTASGEGLRELRGILDVLRQADEPDPTAPVPRLAQLEALIDGTTRAGLPTTLEIRGRPEPPPPAVDLAAYRIIQESLTNALRHAGPTAATVTLSYLEHELVVEVTDAGVGHGAGDASQGGHGIAGMRERAEAAGGTLEAGPRPAGGFGVRAHLPLSRRS